MKKIAAAVNENFDLTPRGMIETFDLLKADIYKGYPERYLWIKVIFTGKNGQG